MTGLWWYDESPHRATEEKIQRAAAHYQKKHGQTPTVCYVNPATPGLTHVQAVVQNIQVKTLRTVPPCNFWIGIEEQPA